MEYISLLSACLKSDYMATLYQDNQSTHQYCPGQIFKYR